MRFKYTAFTEKGTQIKDMVIAKNKKAAESRLASRGLVVESIKPDRVGAVLELARSSVSGVSFKDLIIFTRNLSVMVKSGLTLDESLSILAEQSTNPRLTRILVQLNEQIQAGKTLSEALAQNPKVFSKLYVSIVSAAERSGTLEQSLKYLTDQLTQTYEVRVKIRNALFYPTVVLTATFSVMILLSIFVLPKITKLFSSFKTTLPLATRAIIAISDFATAHTFFLLVLLGLLVIVTPFVLRLAVLRPLTHRLLLKIPIVRHFSRFFNIALFCRTLGTLLISGVPINQALAIASETMRNIFYSRALNDIVAVQQTGETLGALLRQYPKLFPPMVHRMIAVGEESGNMEEILLFLADFHEKEIDNLSKNLTNIMEPVLLIVIGLAVAVVALGIITPIYQITGSFQFK